MNMVSVFTRTEHQHTSGCGITQIFSAKTLAAASKMAYKWARENCSRSFWMARYRDDNYKKIYLD